MKKILLSLGLTTAVTSIVSPAINVKTSTNIINTIPTIPNENSNYNQYKTELVKVMNLKISNNNEEQIKQIILDSFFLLHNQIYINTNLFDNLQDYNMKSLFQDINFEKTIQDMYQNKMIIINEEGKFTFIDFNTQPQSASVWAEGHWYWFGWWKLHFDHDASLSLAHILDVVSGVSEIAQTVAEWFPWTGAMLALFAAFCFGNSIIFRSYDHGKGVWIGWYVVIPDMGWGSN